MKVILRNQACGRRTPGLAMEIMKEYKDDDAIFLCSQESGADVGQEIVKLLGVASTIYI